MTHTTEEDSVPEPQHRPTAPETDSGAPSSTGQVAQEGQASVRAADRRTASDLDPIRARLEAATDGPWQCIAPTRDRRTISVYPGDRGSRTGTEQGLRQAIADMCLIRHAPADIAYLLAEVERLRARRYVPMAEEFQEQLKAHVVRAQTAEAEVERLRGQVAAAKGQCGWRGCRLHRAHLGPCDPSAALSEGSDQ